MESCSSFHQHHKFLELFLQPFLCLKQRAECHLKESSRRYFQRRFGKGKAEANEFGVESTTANRSPKSLFFECILPAQGHSLGAHSSSSDRADMEKTIAEGLHENTASSSQSVAFGCIQCWPSPECIRQKLSRPQGDEVLDIDVNALVW